MADIYICPSKDLNNECTLVRFSLPKPRVGKRSTVVLHVGGHVEGGKDWKQDQEPYERARTKIQSALALDSMTEQQRQSLLPKDETMSLPKVFVIILPEDTVRTAHVATHIRRRLPEAEEYFAFNGEKEPVRTAMELKRLKIELSRSDRNWLGKRVGGLHESDAWIGRALSGQIGVTASQIGVWERIARSRPAEVPYALILEDDVVLLPSFHRDTVKAMVAELDAITVVDSAEGREWHVAYIYLRPEDFPTLTREDDGHLTRPGRYSWSLLACKISTNDENTLPLVS